jgi:hypothetical protein
LNAADPLNALAAILQHGNLTGNEPLKCVLFGLPRISGPGIEEGKKYYLLFHRRGWGTRYDGALATRVSLPNTKFGALAVFQAEGKGRPTKSSRVSEVMFLLFETG